MTASRRTCRPILAGALLCALRLPAMAEDAAPSPGGAEVDLGALTFPVEAAREVTQVVVRVAATFGAAPDAEPHDDSAGILRLRDAALGAVRDTRPHEIREPDGIAAIERRLHRAMAPRAPGLDAVRIVILDVRTADRR